jgi:hypothetical protein
MGLLKSELGFLLYSLKYAHNKENLLMIGRQNIMFQTDDLKKFLLDNNYTFQHSIKHFDFADTLFKHLGFKNVESLDANNFENATHIHDFNMPVPLKLHNKYNYILDAGTTEHIFNVAQVYQNIIDMLEIGGIFVAYIPNNNLSGHGFYQISPELYLAVFSEKYGCKVLELFLNKVDNDIETWTNVNTLNNYRNETKMDTKNPVHVLAIVQKISNTRVSLLDVPPQQYSYEHEHWINDRSRANL